MRTVVRPRRLVGLLLATCVAAPVPLLAPAPAQARQASRPDRTVQPEARRVDRVPTPRPSWWDCGELYVPGAQCTKVALPLDYDRPTGPTTQVAVLRLRAADPALRTGTLFVNPGGPGGSGVELAAAARDFLPAAVLDRFDVVGFDPRGTNLSRGVRSWTTTAEQRAGLSGLAGTVTAFPTGERAETAATRSAAVFGAACSSTGLPLAAAASTTEVARDLDVLRRTVGDDRLSYLGFSYGTYLGEVYANLFPDRVRALALDGVLDPVAWAGTSRTRDVPVTVRIGSARASEEALDELLRRCRSAGPQACTLAGHGDPRRVWSRLRDALRRAPLRVQDGSFVQEYTYPDVVDTLLGILYAPDGWVEADAFLSFLVELQEPSTRPARVAAARVGLRRILAAHQGFGRPVGPGPRVRAARRAADGPAGWTAGGTTSGTAGDPVTPDPAYDNSLEAYQTVLCTDGLAPARASRWPALAARADRRAPGFGRLWAWASAPCARRTWTARDEDVYRGPFTRRTAFPVLFVGTVWDPATPYRSAVAAARTMPGSRLLTSDSWGHTAFGSSACVDAAVTAYLVRLELPARGARCTGVDQPFTSGPGVGAAATRGTAASGPAASGARDVRASLRRPPLSPLTP